MKVSSECVMIWVCWSVRLVHVFGVPANDRFDFPLIREPIDALRAYAAGLGGSSSDRHVRDFHQLFFFATRCCSRWIAAAGVFVSSCRDAGLAGFVSSTRGEDRLGECASQFWGRANWLHLSFKRYRFVSSCAVTLVFRLGDSKDTRRLAIECFGVSGR